MTIPAIDRLRSLLDIYSPSPLSRIVVLATMLLGTVLLARGAASGSVAGAAPFLLLVWANHRRFLATFEGLLERHSWLVFAIPMGVLVARLVAAPPAATDDLLRHIASAFWPGGYEEMYVHSALPPTALYPSFDFAVGALAKAIGMAPAMWVVQGLAFAAFAAAFVRAGSLVIGGHSMAPVLVLAALMIVLQLVAGRLVLARPEILMTAWALAAATVRTTAGAVAWAIGGVLLGTGYWLAALYCPAVILLPGSIRLRSLIFVAMSVAWAAIWWWLTDGRPIETIWWTLEQVSNRLPDLRVSENTSIFNLLIAPPMLLLGIGAAWASGRAGVDNRFLLLAGFYLLSNQARYGGIVAPLLALYILSGARNLELRWPSLLRSASVALASVSAAMLAAGTPSYAALPRFELPAGSVVLTGFNRATYSTTFANPGRVQVAPAFEVGALDPEVQELVRQLVRGRLDCEALSGLGFTHLIEDSLRGQPPECLMLEGTQHAWRLWRIRAHE